MTRSKTPKTVSKTKTRAKKAPRTRKAEKVPTVSEEDSFFKSTDVPKPPPSKTESFFAAPAKRPEPVFKKKETKEVQKVEEKILNTDHQITRDSSFKPATPAKRNIFFALPLYKSTNPGTLWMSVALALDLGKEHSRWDMEVGDAMIYHARNKLATRFLQSECEWMFFLDDDMIFPIGRPNWYRWIGNLPRQEWSDELCSQHVLGRLLSHNLTLVSGTYFGRQVTGRVVSSAAFNQPQNQAARYGNSSLLAVDWTGTGCLLIHRSVLEDIQAVYPELAPDGDRNYWDFFLPTSGKGEDVAFCERAKNAGHQTYLDTGLQGLHVGWCCYGKHNTGLDPVIRAV